MQENSNQNRPAQPLQEMRQAVDLGVGICQVICSIWPAWLHRPGTAGERFFGFQAFLGWIFIPIWGGLMYASEPLWLLLGFWAGTTALLLLHRIRGLARRSSGQRPHSRYTGRPWLPGNEYRIKTLVEPVLVVVLGGTTLNFDGPLGTYLILSGICYFVAGQWQRAMDDARLRAMKDARDEEMWLRSKLNNQE